MVRFLIALFVAVVASTPAPAKTSVSVGVWSGPGPGYHHPGRYWRPYRHYGWGHPYRRYYRPRSVFLYSAPVYSAPVYVAPPPRAIYYPSYPPPARSTGQCQVFSGDAIIDGSGTPFYGRACIFTDGRWHIVQ